MSGPARARRERAAFARVAWAVGIAAAAALTDRAAVLVGLAVVVVAGYALSGRGAALARAIGPALAIAAFALAINVAAGWFSERGPLGGVGSAQDGLVIGAWTAARLFVTALAFGWLASTVRAGQALDALAAGPLRAMGRVGESLFVVALLALRFGPLTLGEARRLVRAVALRTDRRPGPWAARAIAVPLVLAAVRRADRLALVLEARHFGAAARTPRPAVPWGAADRALAAGAALLPLAAWLVRG